MQHTTSPAVSVLEAIPGNLLSHVSGGCGGHKRCCCPVQQTQLQQTQIIQLPVMTAAPATPPPSNDIVSTSVNVNGQVQARA